MTLAETGKLLALIQVYYPKFADGRDISVTINAWHLIFADDQYSKAEKAVVAYVATDTKGFPPMPGALKELMIQKPDSISAMQAWHLVRKAAENSWYSSEEEFRKLPPLCQRIVGAPGTLKDWATMDLAQLESVVGSNFQRSYKQMEKDEIYFAKLPSAVSEHLPGIERIGLMP